MIGHAVELRAVDYTRGKKLRRRRPVSSSAKVGVRHEGLLKGERARLELTYEERRLHTSCLLASTAARQREAHRAANRARLAQTFEAHCRRLSALVGAQTLPECEGRLVHSKRYGWVTVTTGEHDHPFARVLSPSGQWRLVALGVVVEDYGQWLVWDKCMVVNELVHRE